MKRKRLKRLEVAGAIQYGIMVAFDKAYLDGNAFAGIAHTAIRNMDSSVWQNICSDLAKDIINQLDDMEEYESNH